MKKDKKKVIGIAASIVVLVLLVCLWKIGKRLDVPTEKKQEETICLLPDSNVYTMFHDTCNATPKSMDWIPDEDTIEYGILNDETAISESDTKISLESGEKYHKYIDLEQHIEEKGYYSLIVFDNFKQISFLVDGKEMEHCTVGLEYGEEISVPLTIEHLEDGYHRLVFIWLCGVNRSFEEEELEESDYFDACCMWTDVEVGTGQWQPECVSYDGRYFQECNMLVNLQSRYGVDNIVENIIHPKSGDKEIFATVGNNSNDERLEKILWAICDFEQVPIDNSGNYCMYAEVPKNQFISQGIPFGEKTDRSYGYQVFVMDLASGEIDYTNRVLVQR